MKRVIYFFLINYFSKINISSYANICIIDQPLEIGTPKLSFDTSKNMVTLPNDINTIGT